MEKLMKKFEVVKLFLIAALLFITPLLSTSLRSTYLYFILNILILLVSAESGLLSFFLDSPENTKSVITPDHDKQNTGGSDEVEAAVKVKKSPSTPSIFFIEAEDDAGIDDDEQGDEMGADSMLHLEHRAPDDLHHSISSYPSSTMTLSIANHVEHGVPGIASKLPEMGEESGQELFQKAEMFIGNFYKQLKMQREESWKQLHHLYHKAF